MIAPSFHNDFWDALTEREKKEIELGVKQLDAGQRISLADFKKRIAKIPSLLRKRLKSILVNDIRFLTYRLTDIIQTA